MKKLFYNADIIDFDGRYLGDALLTQDGIIRKTGSLDSVRRLADGAEYTDIRGCTLMPSILDAHSHLSALADSLTQADCAGARSFDDIARILKDFAKSSGIKRTEWLRAQGYDHNRLAQKAHPDKEFLDRLFPDLPVVISHKSGHMGVFNSKALELLGCSGSGYLEESAYMDAIKKVPQPKPDELIQSYKKALKIYAGYGITTLQEGMMVSSMTDIFKKLTRENILYLDVAGYPAVSDIDLFLNEFPDRSGRYHNNFRIAGCKIFLDGSPQAGTAWMKTPYKGNPRNYGVSTMTDSAVKDAVNKSVSLQLQLLAHCNGDAAADQFIRCCESAEDRSQLYRLRPVMIHAQLVTDDQLDHMKRLGHYPVVFCCALLLLG